MRLSRVDWIEAAYRALAEAGIQAITVTGLAARLGVTKGSFYWHFTDRGNLVEALLDRWAHERTDELVEDHFRHAPVSDPRQRLRRLFVLGLSVAPIDRAMRLWAQEDPQAANAVREADQALRRHVVDCLKEIGFSPADAALRAELMVRATIGGYFIDNTQASILDLNDVLDLFTQVDQRISQ